MGVCCEREKKVRTSFENHALSSFQVSLRALRGGEGEGAHRRVGKGEGAQRRGEDGEGARGGIARVDVCACCEAISSIQPQALDSDCS